MSIIILLESIRNTISALYVCNQYRKKVAIEQALLARCAHRLFIVHHLQGRNAEDSLHKSVLSSCVSVKKM